LWIVPDYAKDVCGEEGIYHPRKCQRGILKPVETGVYRNVEIGIKYE